MHASMYLCLHFALTFKASLSLRQVEFVVGKTVSRGPSLNMGVQMGERVAAGESACMFVQLRVCPCA